MEIKTTENIGKHGDWMCKWINQGTTHTEFEAYQKKEWVAVNELKEKIDEINKKLAKDYELKLFGAETNHYIDLFYKGLINALFPKTKQEVKD